MASHSNPVQQLLNAEKKAALVVNDARARKYELSGNLSVYSNVIIISVLFRVVFCMYRPITQCGNRGFLPVKL